MYAQRQPPNPSPAQAAARALSAAFRPGDYALRVRGVPSGYCQVFRCRPGVRIDLAHSPPAVRAEANVTRLVAALLGLPLYPRGILPRSDMDLIERLIAAVPTLDTVGLACVYPLYVYYALPGLPRYEIDALGRVRCYDNLKI